MVFWGWGIKNMNKKNRYILIFWGILDLCCVSWYIGANIYNYKIPFYSDILQATQVTKNFGQPNLVIISYLYIPIFLSLIFSGVLLIKQSISGVIVAYIQTFFRVIAFLPISLFFLTWFPKYIFHKPPLILGIVLILFSETLKLWTLIDWHKAYQANKLNLDKSITVTSKEVIEKIEDYNDNRINRKDVADWAKKIVISKEFDGLYKSDNLLGDAILALFELHYEDGSEFNPSIEELNIYRDKLKARE